MLIKIFFAIFSVCLSIKMLKLQSTCQRNLLPSPHYNSPIYDGGWVRLIPVDHPDIVLPLRNININIIIQENIARVEIEQEYENDTPMNLNTEYYFPISQTAVFDSFEAQIGNRTIKGEIKEKKQAHEEFESALAAGNTAALTEITKTRDIMKVSLGNFLPGQKINLKYSYLELLDVTEDTYWSLIVFSTLTPLYAPEGSNAPPITTVHPDFSTYKWTITAEIYSSSPITELKVPTHDTIITSNNNNQYAKVILNPSKKYSPNKNFELDYSTANDHTPQMVIEKYLNKTQNANLNMTSDETDMTNFESNLPSTNDLVGYINFFPSFPVKNYTGFNLLESTNISGNANQTAEEFIFIADRSGSMAGDRVDKLRKALRVFVNSLPDSSYFNIISFGSTFEPMFPKSVKATDGRKFALFMIHHFQADFGGTEILPPLKFALTEPYIKNYPRIIFLLTDGNVANPDQIIDLTKQNKYRARVNSIGIGNGISNYLIRGVANAGGGSYTFVNDNQNLDKRVVDSLNESISPYLTDFRIKFSDNSMIRNTYPAKNELQFVLKNNAFKFFYFLDSGFRIANNQGFYVSISYYDSSMNHKYEYNLSLADATLTNGTIFHKFAIKKRIDDLTEQAKLNPAENQAIIDQIVNFSIKYQVLSDYTAFVMTIQGNEELTEPGINVLIPNIESTDNLRRRNGYSGPPLRIGPPFMYTSGPSIPSLNDLATARAIASMAASNAIPSFAPSIDTIPPQPPSIKLYSLIPYSFWLSNYTHIALKTYNGTYLSCDGQGKIAFSNNISPDSIWTPGLDNDLLYLKSHSGGYLSFDENCIRCDSNSPDNSSALTFTVISTTPLSVYIKNQNGISLMTNKSIPESNKFHPPNTNRTNSFGTSIIE